MTIASFFESGTAVDLVLAMVAVEALLLAFAARATGRLGLLRGLGWSLASGACLALALRVALSSGPWPLIALALLGSFATHLVDLVTRWKAAAPRAH